jgi:hypothetical protein
MTLIIKIFLIESVPLQGEKDNIPCSDFYVSKAGSSGY